MCLNTVGRVPSDVTAGARPAGRSGSTALSETAYRAVSQDEQQCDKKRLDGVDKQIEVFPFLVWHYPAYRSVDRHDKNEYDKIARQTTL